MLVGTHVAMVTDQNGLYTRLKHKVIHYSQQILYTDKKMDLQVSSLQADFQVIL